MRKYIFISLLSVLILSILCSCSNVSNETFTVTFKQNGFEPITRMVNSGETIKNIPETRGDGSGLVIEWNFDEKKPITKDLTVETIAYTAGLTFALNLKKEAYNVTTYQGDSTKVFVPDYFKGLPVAGIGTLVFSSNDRITYVKLPSRLKSIGEHAFYYCTALENVDMPDEVEMIGASAFDSCVSLKGLNIPSGITEIPKRFAVGHKYSYIEVPEGVTSIGEYAFASEMTDIVLPATLSKIDYLGLWKPLKRIYYRGSRAMWDEVDISIEEYNDFSAASVAENATIYFFSEYKPVEKGIFWHYIDGKAAIWD